MTKKIKLVSTLGTFVTLALPISALACETSVTLRHKVNAFHAEDKVVLVTDGANVNDKSFNEQAANALRTITNKDAIVENEDWTKPSSHDAGDIVNSYINMQKKGAKLVLAPGFFHAGAIAKYNAEVADKMNFVLVDDNVGPTWYEDTNTNATAPNVASIIFDTKYAGFQAGLLTGAYLKAKGDTTPTVGTFGGKNYPGVTDFMTGFVYGIRFHNISATTKVKFATFANDNAYTSSGFNPGEGRDEAKILIDGGADVILPVAGAQTSDVITEIKASNDSIKNRVKIIGVDTDQAKSYPDDKELFVTSIEKKVQKAYEETYKILLGNSTSSAFKGFGWVSIGSLSDQMVGISNNVSDGAWDGILPIEGPTSPLGMYTTMSSWTETQINIASVVNNKNLKDHSWSDALIELKKMNSHTA